ncbi:unnamed protein product [Vicia faba]|uniref:Uncharacterized protein n=1 Tax=Vicia faba TaxID=3906 RepID=A0AAV1AGD8_VICFA|nr:unnamed protein product [Vicia faba]
MYQHHFKPNGDMTRPVNEKGWNPATQPNPNCINKKKPSLQSFQGQSNVQRNLKLRSSKKPNPKPYHNFIYTNPLEIKQGKNIAHRNHKKPRPPSHKTQRCVIIFPNVKPFRFEKEEEEKSRNRKQIKNKRESKKDLTEEIPEATSSSSSPILASKAS